MKEILVKKRIRADSFVIRTDSEELKVNGGIKQALGVRGNKGAVLSLKSNASYKDIYKWRCKELAWRPIDPKITWRNFV